MKMSIKQILELAFLILLITMYIFIQPGKIKWKQKEIIVYKGDTLWKLSERFCPKTVDRREWIYKVKKLNDTNGNIKEGQTLIVLEMITNENNNFKTKK